ARLEGGGQGVDQPALHAPVAGPVERPAGLLPGPGGGHGGREVGQPGTGLGQLAGGEGGPDEAGEVGGLGGGVGGQGVQGGEGLGPGPPAPGDEGGRLPVGGGG